MKRQNKDKNSGVSGFLRYFMNETSSKERNTFERELQKDPFAEEAAEGFSSTDPLIAKKDLENLMVKLNRRTQRRNATIIYRIAASVAVLLVISSVFLLVNRRTEELPDAETGQNTLEIARAEPYFREDRPEDIPEKIVTSPAPVEKKPAVPAAVRKNPEISKNDIPEISNNDINITGKKSDDSVPAQPEKEQAETTRQRRMVAAPVPDAASVRSAPAKQAIISGRVISTEDNLPVPGATVNIKGTQRSVATNDQGVFLMPVREEESVTLVTSFIGMKTQQMEASPGSELEIRLQPDLSALSEVVVVGYGTSKKTGEADNSDYIAPEPAGGRKAFDNYIENNIRRPDSLTGQRVVVVAGLKIRADGTTDSIRIIRSPDSTFSVEAIRLIKEGPPWKPAMQNGTPVDDEVRIRIVFR